MNKISCIICAFNEEPRINNVLAALKEHPLVDEVIVVDDGSIDGTKKIVEQNKWVKLISHEKNLGKSSAMCTGILSSKNDFLMFLDADLTNITRDDITDLAMPVIENRSDVSISIRKNSLLIYKLIGLDFCSGERVIHKKYLVNCVKEIKQLPGYGVEIFVNRILIEHKLRISVVKWKSVIHIMKTKKIGFWHGIKGEIKMDIELIKFSSVKEILYQNYKLLQSRID